MSDTAQRIKSTEAIAIARALGKSWGIVGHGGGFAIVGSVRRYKPDVGDIELIGPMPGPDPTQAMMDVELQEKHLEKHGTAAADSFYNAIKATMSEAKGGLFVAEPGAVLGVAVKGLKPGFKMCDLDIDLAALSEKRFEGDEPSPVPVPRFGVQIFRYWPGPFGNRGWIQLMRTGPADFSEWLLTKWKYNRQIGPDAPGSVQGYLVDQYGKPVPTETEQEVFEKAGIKYIQPQLREQFVNEVNRARRMAGRKERAA